MSLLSCVLRRFSSLRSGLSSYSRWFCSLASTSVGVGSTRGFGFFTFWLALADFLLDLGLFGVRMTKVLSKMRSLEPPGWTDDDDTTRIEQLTIRYTPEQCQMAEIDAAQEAMLRTRAGGQENPGIKLLEEYNIRVSNILDGDPWANISQRVMEGEFRKLRITVTLETARQATNRHQEAVTNRTHGTQLLLRRQHKDPEYAIEEYWALIEDDSGPRLLGMIDNSRFMGITGMDVLGEIITPDRL